MVGCFGLVFPMFGSGVGSRCPILVHLMCPRGLVVGFRCDSFWWVVGGRPFGFGEVVSACLLGISREGFGKCLALYPCRLCRCCVCPTSRHDACRRVCRFVCCLIYRLVSGRCRVCRLFCSPACRLVCRHVCRHVWVRVCRLVSGRCRFGFGSDLRVGGNPGRSFVLSL